MKLYCKNHILRATAMTLLLAVFAFLSCSIDDDRDACCDDNMMLYRFLYEGSDCFAQRITKMQYHLFHADGTYLRQMYAHQGELSRVSLAGLPQGEYALVAVGNLTDYGTLTDAAAGGLDRFCLHITHYAEGHADTFANGDPLYYGIRRFSIEAGTSNSYITDMTHIHCCLHLRIQWEGVPAYSEGYRYHLSGIGGGVDMHTGNASYIDGLPFPGVHHYGGQMTEDVRLQSLALQQRLYTLRYTDTDIPVFRLYNKNKAVTKPIELRPVFRSWGWSPSSNPVQEYEVLMIIKLNGDIEIRQGFGTNVSDWEDGGVIGG